jgi:hypothetical protein
MKILFLACALACGSGLVMAAQAAPQDTHAGHAPVAAPAQRWATDAPLREGMSRVSAALDALKDYEMGQMSEAVALDQIATIEEATTSMFVNCNLAPDADAALHGMLGPLLAAAYRLKANPQDTDAVAAMRVAVADYPRYFDDPQAAAP